jgi:caffeoyl-CoA O-methyltransferase
MHRRFCVILAVLVTTACVLPAPAQPPGPPGRRGPWHMESTNDLAKPPQAADEAEGRILAVLDNISRNERFANVSLTDGRLLRQLTEAVGAKRVVELGTSTGYSGLWLAMALRTTGGHLYTHEIDHDRAEIARKNFHEAGVADLVTIVEGDAHQTVSRYTEPIDVLFIDADKEGYTDYLQKLLPLVRPGGLILAHNMRQPRPDPRYIKAITTNPALETTFVLMDGAGIGVTLKKREAE